MADSRREKRLPLGDRPASRRGAPRVGDAAARKVLLSDVAPKEVAGRIRTTREGARAPCLTCPRRSGNDGRGSAKGAGSARRSRSTRTRIEGWISALPETARVFLLDGVTDPQKPRAIVRSARAFAFDGVVLPADRSCPVTGAVFRASAGAVAHVPVVQVTKPGPRHRAVAGGGILALRCRRDGGNGSFRVRTAKRTAIVLGARRRGAPVGARTVRRRRPNPDGPRNRVAERLRCAGIIAYSIRKPLTSPPDRVKLTDSGSRSRCAPT